MNQGRLPEKCAECGQLIVHDDDYAPIVEGDLILQPGRNTVVWKEQSIQLSPGEFGTLRCIVKRGKILVRKLTIYTEVFEKPDGTPEPKIVDVIVCKLRRKLETIGAGGLIETLWGQGFRFDPTNGSFPTSTGQMRRSVAKRSN